MRPESTPKSGPVPCAASQAEPSCPVGRGRFHADRAALHQSRAVALRGHRVPHCTTSEIRNPDGSVVFQLDDIEVPETWSQVASDVLAQKYFRKAGVPARLKKVEENDVPSWLWRSVADEAALAELPEDERTGREISSQAGVRPARRHAGPIGAGRAAISPPRRMRRPSLTSCASCWRTRWWRRTRRNGSTPACIGPTASTARARATTTSTTRPAS